MNRFTQLFIFLALATGRLFALELQVPPPPSSVSASPIGAVTAGPDGAILFVGHYGESIIIPNGWTANAELRDATEIVYFHRKSHDDLGYKPFEPKPADFKLENFAPMGLMELIVVPKNAPGGLRSLQEIRTAKEKELSAANVAYKAVDDTGAWPPGTFTVKTTRPFKVEQTYSQSKKEFYIFTAGAALQKGEYGLSQNRVLEYRYAAVDALDSLLEHLSAVSGPSTAGGMFSHASKTQDILHYFKVPRFLALYGILAASLLVLARLPANPRARLFGWSLFFFSHLAAMTGFLVLFIPARFAGFAWNNLGDAALFPVLLIPATAWFAARRFGSLHSRRVLAVIGVLSSLGAAFMLQGSSSTSPLPAEVKLFGGTVVLLIFGFLSGLAFALAFGPIKGEVPCQGGREAQ